MSDGWESKAHDWIAWARTPGHDAYWDYRDAFFALLPQGPHNVLEIGCGEGRVSRDLAARGHSVTGLDASPTLLKAAAEADPGSHYVVGPAEALPFDDGSFDLVVAYNSLMDVQDMPRAVAEAARVLTPGGRFAACVTHPIADAGRFREDGAFVIPGSYLTPGDFHFDADKNGLTITFDGRAFPLHSYTSALEEAGFAIEAMREPAGPEDDPKWTRIPAFLMWRATASSVPPPSYL